MKQTAVEWLRDLYENQPAYEEYILDEQWQKAIEMEKEQIRMAYEKGLIDGIHGPRKECYNETFNSNEK